jgi:predicted cupin superfamily sugar epimerase
MDSRAAHLIRELDLQPHPEGGYFREVFRSAREVQPRDSRPARSALTTIYFLLPEGQHSRWHRVASDEVWHFHEGEPLELFWVDSRGVVHRELLGGVGGSVRPVRVVPAGCWQAARPTGSYALVGCTVGPGFDFDDFEMVDETSPAWEMLQDLDGFPEGLGKLRVKE